MDKMKAVVFRGVGDLRLEEVPKPSRGRRGGDTHHGDDDLRHRRAIVKGEYRSVTG